jgi:UDP-N-acetylmuramyl pentapeptide phosphotransferase/UDP-N-acetylglucosamine-1-phosphate transferase
MVFHPFPAVLAAAASWGLLRVLIPRLRCRLLDQPNERSSHRQPKPRGGGLAFVLVASAASALAWLLSSFSDSVPLPLVATPLFALPLALVGFLDDCHNLPASWRYSAQLGTALVVVLVSPLVAPSFGLLPLLVLLIAVTAVIDFTNFMDGLDGLVAGCMAVAMATGAIQLAAPWPIWALVGSLLGFLLWNWSPAKVFMGDVGSTFLGAVFAGLVLQCSSWTSALGLLLVATPLLGDACLCVCRRLVARQQVFQAHRMHLYQRLHQAGWTHSKVAFLYIAATFLLAVSFLSGGLQWLLPIALVELLIGAWLDQNKAMPFQLPRD